MVIMSGSNRGQAYSLEAIAGSVIVVTALLFALQSIIITPTTSSGVDPDVRKDLRAQASDMLVIVDNNETTDLSYYTRLWVPESQTFEGAQNPSVGYGTTRPPGIFGEILNTTFKENSRLYNVEVLYLGTNATDDRGRVPMTYHGQPAEGAVTASYTVTLYDNQTLTSGKTGTAELWEYDTDPNSEGYYPIPNAVEGPVYNVVEVRLTVW